MTRDMTTHIANIEHSSNDISCSMCDNKETSVAVIVEEGRYTFVCSECRDDIIISEISNGDKPIYLPELIVNIFPAEKRKD